MFCKSKKIWIITNLVKIVLPISIQLVPMFGCLSESISFQSIICALQLPIKSLLCICAYRCNCILSALVLCKKAVPIFLRADSCEGLHLSRFKHAFWDCDYPNPLLRLHVQVAVDPSRHQILTRNKILCQVEEAVKII